MSSLTPAQHKEEDDVKNMINMLLYALFKNDTDMLRKYLNNKETILSYLRKNDHRAWTLLYMINDVESLIKMLRNYKDEHIKAECIEFSDNLEKLHKGYVAKRVIGRTVTTHHNGLYVHNQQTRNIMQPTTMHSHHFNGWWHTLPIHQPQRMPFAHATPRHTTAPVVRSTATSAKPTSTPAQHTAAAAKPPVFHGQPAAAAAKAPDTATTQSVVDIVKKIADSAIASAKHSHSNATERAEDENIPKHQFHNTQTALDAAKRRNKQQNFKDMRATMHPPSVIKEESHSMTRETTPAAASHAQVTHPKGWYGTPDTGRSLAEIVGKMTI